jgi:DNA-binding NtrC family response regulator
MGGLPEGVFESELFGHVRGAFTDAKGDRAGRFELAEGGTLFMDEIGNIPSAQQAKILRALERGEFERVGSSRTIRANVRLISATNCDLSAEVASGRFRQDLLFRLNTIQIHLPPLGSAGRTSTSWPSTSSSSTPSATASRSRASTRTPWPRCAATRGPATSASSTTPWSGPSSWRRAGSSGASDLALNAAAAAPRLDDMSLEEVEAHLIKKTLARCDGNARRAAELLGLSRSAFYRSLEKYGL